MTGHSSLSEVRDTERALALIRRTRETTGKHAATDFNFDSNGLFTESEDTRRHAPNYVGLACRRVASSV